MGLEKLMLSSFDGADAAGVPVHISSKATTLILRKFLTHLTKALFSAIGPRYFLAKSVVLYGLASPIPENSTSLPSVS